ncbi:MAG: hypothetical protein GY703_20125 [Gammaproteobacteria bacterium]|nr:hypothetical protein [Gammaproteobacteria bacterium]
MKFSDPVLRGDVRKAGYRLRREGLSEGATAHLFGLIREQAGRTLKMCHYPVQVMGGWVMINGLLAEMDTGEGKTLATTLPAAELAGIRVHVITVNDYFAARDAELMGPLYRALGLRVGTVVEDMSNNERQEAYRCDVTCCSNKQVAFDYLRDRMVLGDRPDRLWLELESGTGEQGGRESKLLMQGLSFAIVDEADGVLIDEARTPLILSREGESGQMQEVCKQAIQMARKLWQGWDFRIDRKQRELRLTECGRERAERMGEEVGGIWTGRRHRKSQRRNLGQKIYRTCDQKWQQVVQRVGGGVESILVDRSDLVQVGQEVAHLESSVEEAVVAQVRTQSLMEGDIMVKRAKLKFARNRWSRLPKNCRQIS